MAGRIERFLKSVSWSTVVVLLLGNGVVTSVAGYLLAKRSAVVSEALATAELRRSLDRVLTEATSIMAESLRGVEVDSTGRPTKPIENLKYINAVLAGKRSDYSAIEQKLAELEGREPRVFPVFINPPTGPGWK